MVVLAGRSSLRKPPSSHRVATFAARVFFPPTDLNSAATRFLAILQVSGSISAAQNLRPWPRLATAHAVVPVTRFWSLPQGPGDHLPHLGLGQVPTIEIDRQTQVSPLFWGKRPT